MPSTVLANASLTQIKATPHEAPCASLIRISTELSCCCHFPRPNFHHLSRVTQAISYARQTATIHSACMCPTADSLTGPHTVSQFLPTIHTCESECSMLLLDVYYVAINTFTLPNHINIIIIIVMAPPDGPRLLSVSRVSAGRA